MYGFNAQGFGAVSPEEIMALRDALQAQRMRKGMSAGYNTPDLAQIQNPLIPQNLEGTLATATYDADDVVFWKRVHKNPVFATVAEFSRVNTHGNAEIDPFFTEGGTPSGVSADYERAFTKIQYLGVKGSTTFAMLNTKIVGSNPTAEAEEVQRKTLHLLGRIESSLYFADTNHNPMAFDGLRATLEKQAPANIMDMRGQMLTGKAMRDDFKNQRNLFAKPDLVLMSHDVRNILGNLGEGSIRRPLTGSAMASNQRIGMAAEGITADHGYVPFESTVFLKPGGQPNASKVEPDSQAAAPGVPVLTSAVAGALGGGEKSLFTNDDVGSYGYRVVAVGPNGVSAPLSINPVAVAAGQKVTITIAIPGGATVWYYRVFRTVKGAATATATFIVNAKQTTVGNPPAADPTIIKDFNYDLPNTCWTFSLQMTPDVVEFVRLLDFMKLDLGIRSTTKEFLLMLFGAFRSRTPTKLWAWKNCATVTE